MGYHSASHSFAERRKGGEEASGESWQDFKERQGELDDIFVVEYTKRGSTREWDKGKKVPI
jgi:hypothetical protein